jgi:uncharacterized protein (TIGR02118 family)
MIKLLALQRRRPGLSRDEFRRIYETEHAPLFARTIPAEVSSAISYYVQNHAVSLSEGGSEPPYDCVTEFGFASLEEMRVWTSWYLSDAGEVLRADEERFMDTAGRVVIVTEAQTLPHA